MISRVIRGWGFAVVYGAWLAASPAVARAEGTIPAAVPEGSAATAGSQRVDSTAVGFPELRVRHWQVGLFRPDRMQHASLSLTLGLAAGLISRKPVIAACGSLALGLAKELHDIGGSGFDPVDLCADALGAGASALGTRFVEN